MVSSKSFVSRQPEIYKKLGFVVNEKIFRERKQKQSVLRKIKSKPEKKNWYGNLPYLESTN